MHVHKRLSKLLNLNQISFSDVLSRVAWLSTQLETRRAARTRPWTLYSILGFCHCYNFKYVKMSYHYNHYVFYDDHQASCGRNANKSTACGRVSAFYFLPSKYCKHSPPSPSYKQTYFVVRLAFGYSNLTSNLTRYNHSYTKSTCFLAARTSLIFLYVLILYR